MKQTPNLKTHFLLTLLFCLSVSSSYAKYPLVRNFSRLTYQGGKQNWCIEQDKDHKMYFANNNGLLEFDSNIWRLYPIANYTNVRSIMYDREDGRIYAGAFNEFGYYSYEEDSYNLTYRSLTDKLPHHHRNFNEIWNISKDENQIYFQSDHHIFKYNGEYTKVFSFDYRIEKSATLFNTFILTSAEEGVRTLNGDIILKLPESDILKGKKVVAILPYINKQVLFVTDFHGVYIFDGKGVIPFEMDITDFLKENQVFSACIQNEKIAFGTVSKGLVIKDLKSDKNTFVNTFSGLQNNTILSSRFDEEGNLWLGLDKGIDYVLINTPINNLFSNNQIYGSGYTSLVKDETLYLGTNQGLYTTSYPVINSPEPTSLQLVQNMQSQVWCLREIDNLIFCGNDQGAFIIKGNKITRIPYVNGTWNFKRLNTNSNYILGCSYQGLYLLKKNISGEWVFSHFIKGFSESSGTYEEDENGDIWFSHWMKGIYRLTLNASMDSVEHISLYDYNKGLPLNENNVINRFENKVIFSSQYGFYEYSPENDRLERTEEINEIFGFPKAAVRLHESPEKDIWAVSTEFICRVKNHGENSYTLDSITYKSLQEKLIIGFEHFNFIDKENILIATEDGFSYINPTMDKGEVNSADVFISKIYAINYKDSLLYSKGGYENNPQSIYDFPYTLNSLRIEFVLPEYQHESAIQYSYILENYDDKWSNYSSENFKEYTKLNNGTYQFKVRAYNKLDSTVSETSFRFRILPPWYLSPFALLGYFLSFMALMFGVYTFFNRRSEKAVQQVEKEKERQLKEQKKWFMADAEKKEREIMELKNQQLQYDLRHKSHELADSTMNLIRKNEILLEISSDIEKLIESLKKKEETLDYYRKLNAINENIKENIEHDNDWKKFEQNFDLVYQDYLERLSKEFPQLNTNDKKLCAYLKMNLSSKDIAPLLNISVRSVETTRYRLRKKMGLSRDVNLSEFLQKF